MRMKLLAAIFCLLAFMAELVLDSSTAFVRECSASPANGSLFVAKFQSHSRKKPYKHHSKRHLCGMRQRDTHHKQSNGTPKVGVSSYVGQVAALVAIQILLPVARLEWSPPPFQARMHQSDLERPPSA